MSNTWILVADASRARIFTSDAHFRELLETQTFSHAESRLHDQELTSDLPGRSMNSTGKVRHAMEQNTDPKKQQAIEFAHNLADTIEHARTQNQLDSLIIIASPNMLGHLRHAMSKESTKLVSDEINQDLTQHTLEEIRKHLQDRRVLT